MFRYGVGDVDVGGLARLQVVVDGLDHGGEDAVGFW